MINQLKYWDGAKPGLKRKPEVSREVEEDQARKKKRNLKQMRLTELGH